MSVIIENIESLNAAQQEAVLLQNENALVLAGAGSGKTRVLTHRIAYLCQEKNVSPLNILAVTFTNKAAREMRGRVEELLGFSTVGMWIGTFHGIAHRLLRQHAQEMGFNRNFKVLDQDDQLQLIKKVIQSLNLDEKYYPPKYSQAFINGKKDEGIRAINLPKAHFDIEVIKIYQAYEARLKADNALDFADLLLYAYELFKQNEILRNYYQKRFHYVLVDEFQDTNIVQYKWLMCLKSDANSFMAVGDDDQSIYGWRGAKIENIEHFLSDLNPVKIVRLEQNYRSTQIILDAANAVIANNSKRMGKVLWSKEEKGEKIAVYEAFNERDEADYIVQKIQDLSNNQGVNLSHIAILYRSNAQSRVIEEALLKLGISYRIYGGLRFFDRAEIKDALAYMRLIALRADNLAFERVVNLPVRGIGLKTLDNIRDYARLHGLSLWQATVQMIDTNQLPSRSAQALGRFISLIEDMAALKDTLSLGQLMRHVIEVSGLSLMYEASKSEKSQQKCENLRELVTAASEFIPPVEAVNDQDLLLEFLSFAVLESGEMQADDHSEAVQLMTLHTAKGLEFPYVFISGLEDGLFPSSRSLDDADKLAEERRLCYVGITRAMRNLTLSFSKVRHQYGDINYQVKSRFLNEIPKEYLHQVRQLATPKSAGFGISPFEFVNMQQEESQSQFKTGSFVTHPKFGIGVILKTEGQGDDLCYHIDFKAGGGRKVLLAKMAKLSKL
ncbi:DNA helicase II [Caedibacter taeniospiralis]|jgi:DNA helicase-2/ATP-dependent DNA helicase PcrA|uniref:DNA helicase II n=1 Tax=Caedibacter taeniospiralis TaxID=28907 RepID=UPI0037C046DB